MKPIDPVANASLERCSRRCAPMMEALDPRRLLSSTVPSIAGLWTGTRTESGLNSGAFASVTLNLNLKQSASTVTGTELRTSPTDSEYFAQMVTGGTMVGNTYNMQDQSITAQRTTSNYKWLLYSAALQLSPDGQTLSGAWHASGFHGTITLQRDPLPQITLDYAKARGTTDVTFHYTIATARVTHALRIQIYRSATPHLMASSQLIRSVALPVHSHRQYLAIGTHRVTLSAPLSGDKARPYVIVVINGDAAVVESADSINTAWFKLNSF